MMWQMNHGKSLIYVLLTIYSSWTYGARIVFRQKGIWKFQIRYSWRLREPINSKSVSAITLYFTYISNRLMTTCALDVNSTSSRSNRVQLELLDKRAVIVAPVDFFINFGKVHMAALSWMAYWLQSIEKSCTNLILETRSIWSKNCTFIWICILVAISSASFATLLSKTLGMKISQYVRPSRTNLIGNSRDENTLSVPSSFHQTYDDGSHSTDWTTSKKSHL